MTRYDQNVNDVTIHFMIRRNIRINRIKTKLTQIKTTLDKDLIMTRTEIGIRGQRNFAGPDRLFCATVFFAYKYSKPS